MKPFFFLLIGLLWSCTEAQMTKDLTESKTFSFLALGDSYTIGEAVVVADRWPVQLVTRLRKEGIDVLDPQIIATTGWTTDELQSAINTEQPSSDNDLVSLLIGVNNQYRGYSISQYEKEFDELLSQAISFANGMTQNVFVISIPDYGVTPFAKERNLDADKIANELNAYNEMAKKIASSKGVQFFEITEWSRNAETDPSLVASDGLHPSGKMYENWVDTCFEWVLINLQGR
jgi:lysophospholipase L1-like esterase